MGGTTRITCGDFGGVNQQGAPCGVATIEGPCRLHLEQVEVAKSAHYTDLSTILDPSFGFRVPPFSRLRDKVAIVGFTGHRADALKLDDSFELWGLNELYRYMPADRFHRWFEIHGREYLCQDDDGKKHIEDLKTKLGDIPIYMHQRHEDIPGSVKFPKDMMCEALDSDYFTNCPAIMLGLAISMGYKEIHVYGVDMATDSEYQIQRCCCEHWIGVAKGRGIKIFVPELSDLLKCIGFYGYEDQGSVFSRKLKDRLKWLHDQDNQRLASIRTIEAQYKTQHTELSNRISRFEGAIEELQLARKSERRDDRIAARQAELTSTRETIGKLNDEYTNKHTTLIADRNQIVGGIHDVEYLIRSWAVQASAVDGGTIPTIEERGADPRIGELELIASDDSVAKQPAGVYT